MRTLSWVDQGLPVYCHVRPSLAPVAPREVTAAISSVSGAMWGPGRQQGLFWQTCLDCVLSALAPLL